jgi:hypothetical protein
MLICSASSVKQLLVVRNVAPPDTISLKLSQQLCACTLYCEVFSEEATNTNFIVFGLTQSGFEPTIYSTPGEHGNHFTTDAVTSHEKKEK